MTPLSKKVKNKNRNKLQKWVRFRIAKNNKKHIKKLIMWLDIKRKKRNKNI